MIRFQPGRQYSAFSYVSKGTPRDIVTDAKVRVPEVFPGLDHEYISLKALWDTGATHSVISDSLARQLHLPPIGRATTWGLHGGKVVDMFVIDILLMDRVSFPQWRVSSGDTGPTKPGLIIGMDIITKGDFALTKHAGACVFSFCIPSTETTVDYLPPLDLHNREMARIRGQPLPAKPNVAPPPRHGGKRKR